MGQGPFSTVLLWQNQAKFAYSNNKLLQKRISLPGDHTQRQESKSQIHLPLVTWLSD